MRLSWKEERVFECTRAPVIKLNDPGVMATCSSYHLINSAYLLFLVTAH